MTPRVLSAVLLAAIMLAGCSAATPTLIPTLAVPTASTSGTAAAPTGSIIASAEVVPSQTVDLSFAVAGVVQEVHVIEGDQVQAGDPLASLGNLDQLLSAIEASRKNLASAQSAYERLQQNAPLALAGAQFAIVAAQKRYDDAVKFQKRTDYARCDQDTIDLFHSRLTDAKERLDDLRDDNDQSTVHLQKIYDAQRDFDVANANYLFCIQYTDQEIAESDAELAVSQAELNHAQARYELLEENGGVDPDEAIRLQASIATAQASLDSASLALERAALDAPFAGTIIAAQATPGQTVSPGVVVFTIADLGRLLIETTDLSERDINQVRVGQSTTVRIDALGEQYPGKVVKIAERATKLGGDVVYKVTIQLDERPAGLRWGMSATAQIGP